MADVKDKPQIRRVVPAAAIAGGEILIEGSGFNHGHRAQVKFGETPASVTIAADHFLLATVPENSTGKSVRVLTGRGESAPAIVELAASVADNLHPVANPAVDPDGNVYVTFSGRRGQKVPIAIYKICRDSAVKPFVGDLMNATGLALDSSGRLFVSSRYDGVVYQVSPEGRKTVYAEGLGIATGVAFDAEENLYVGDRGGTIFRVGRNRQILVFATLEPSVAAYHLAFGPDQQLYVSGPTTSSHDCVYRIAENGQVAVYYRGLGRPQGLAFDSEGNLYVAASYQGRRGILRLRGGGEPELIISGPNLVGLAFAPPAPGGLFLATTNALYHLPWPVGGLLPRR